MALVLCQAAFPVTRLIPILSRSRFLAQTIRRIGNLYRHFLVFLFRNQSHIQQTFISIIHPRSSERFIHPLIHFDHLYLKFFLIQHLLSNKHADCCAFICAEHAANCRISLRRNIPKPPSAKRHRSTAPLIERQKRSSHHRESVREYHAPCRRRAARFIAPAWVSCLG